MTTPAKQPLMSPTEVNELDTVQVVQAQGSSPATPASAVAASSSEVSMPIPPPGTYEKQGTMNSNDTVYLLSTMPRSQTNDRSFLSIQDTPSYIKRLETGGTLLAPPRRAPTPHADELETLDTAAVSTTPVAVAPVVQVMKVTKVESADDPILDDVSADMHMIESAETRAAAISQPVSMVAPDMEAMEVDAEVVKEARAPLQRRMTMDLHREATRDFKRAIKKLKGLEEIKVSQKHQLVEQNKFCQQESKYIIYNTLQRPKKGEEHLVEALFNVDMKHEGLACVPGDCRHWSIDFEDLPVGRRDEGYVEGEPGNPFLRIEREGTCICCPCQKQKPATIYELRPEGDDAPPRKLGTLKDSGLCRCCYVQYQVMDPNEKVWLQTSMCTPCKMGPCCRCPGCKVDFEVMDDTQQEAARIRKQWTCGECCPCPCCMNDLEHYGVLYQEEVKPDYKMLLMALSVFIHVRFYDHPAAQSHAVGAQNAEEMATLRTLKSQTSIRDINFKRRASRKGSRKSLRGLEDSGAASSGGVMVEMR